MRIADRTSMPIRDRIERNTHPIQSMDSINILSTIDLLRSICVQFDKQIIISTHDENFFALLQRKIPAQIFGSKFLQLEKFGVVVPVQPFVN